MSKVQILRALLKQRLPADDEEEIFELFERTAAEYEEELCGLKEENERQRKLLDAAFNSDDKTDVQQLLVKETEVLPGGHAWTSSLDQGDPELHHIKKEEEELWTCEKRKHFRVLESNSSIYANDVKPQFSHYHQPQSEENREAESLASSSAEQITMDDDNKDWGRSEPVSRLDQESCLHQCSDPMTSHSAGPESEVSDVDLKTREPKSDLNSLKLPVCGNRYDAVVNPCVPECDQRNVHSSNLMRNDGVHTQEKLFSYSGDAEIFSQKGKLKKYMTIHTQSIPFRCPECGKTFSENGNLQKHMKTHMGTQKPFTCSECGKKFSQKRCLQTHMLIHTGERPFSCSECGKSFNVKSNMKTHMRIHTGEKPFSCSECGKSFNIKNNLKTHMRIHTGERPFSCSECGKTFHKNTDLYSHVLIHKDQRAFSCSECGKAFNENSTLKAHMLIHTGERPFSCSECGKTFNQNFNLKTHMVIHTGERPFSCSECGKTFNKESILKAHMIVHKGNKPFNCSECGKAFFMKGNLKSHMTTHTGEKPFSCSDCGKTFSEKRRLKNHMMVHARARTNNINH